MLTPEYLAQCADTILGLYDELDRAIIADIARRIVKTGGITPTAAHQIDKVQQSGLLLDEVTEQVSDVSGLSQDEIERLFEDSGLVSVRNDAKPLLDAGVVKNVSLSPAMKQTLEAAVSKTNGDLRNLTLTTGVTAANKYLNACNAAYMKVSSGAFSYDQAIRQAIRDAASDGNWVSYASGHRDRLDVAIRRSVLTGVNQTAGKLTELYASDMGCEYYETSAHAGARPSHSVWQGRVFKIEGSTSDYPNFAEETGYGTGAGLCGWNCRHSFYPFFPGISKPAYTQKQLDWYDAPRFSYNGADLTEYEVSQLMRRNERNIRTTKRELAGYRAAADEATDEQLRAALQEEFEKASVKLKNQEARYKDLCRQTNHKTDSKRTSVVATKDKNGRIVSWNASTAQKARYGAARQQTIAFEKSQARKAAAAVEKNTKNSIMESDLGKFKQRLRNDNRIDDNYYSILKDKFSHGSDDAKKLFTKYVPQDAVKNASYNGTARYDPNTKKISMHYGMDSVGNRGAGVTWFHEHGHLIDDAAGWVSDDSDFKDLLVKDSFEYRKAYGIKHGLSTWDKIDSAISKDLSSMREHSAVSDLMDALTKGNVSGIAGHSRNYWKNKTNLTSEAFAHMFEAQFDGVRYAEMKKYFPESLKYFEKMMKGMI